MYWRTRRICCRCAVVSGARVAAQSSISAWLNPLMLRSGARRGVDQKSPLA